MHEFALPLSLDDGVHLAHALSARLASENKSRLLSVKGDSASLYGLRPARVSADADVWVEPDRFGDMQAALLRCGWTPREGSDLGSVLVTHSVTFVHPDWPCDIDLHTTFPGFLADGQAVFAELWRRRGAMVQARVEVPIPDQSGAVLISALHALRTPSQTPRHGAEMRSLVEASLNLPIEMREDIVVLAIATGAVDTARPFLATLEVPLPAPTPYGVKPSLDEWRARVSAEGVLGAQAWIAMSRVPWHRRPGAAWRVMWPREHDFRLDHPEVQPGRSAFRRARTARFARGLLQIPIVLRGRIQARRGLADTSLLGENE